MEIQLALQPRGLGSLVWPVTSWQLRLRAHMSASERSFSAGKDLLGISRFFLKADTMEACICHRSWLRCDGLATTLGRQAPECQSDLVENDVDSSDDDFSDH